MGFLGGLLDYASHAVQPALQVATARAQGQLAGKRQQMQEMLQQIALQRQAREDAVKQALAQSTMQHNADLGKHYQNQDAAPKAPIPGSPEWQAAERFKASLAPKAPVMGSPEWLAAQTQLAKIHQQYAPQPQPTNVYLPSVNKETGETDYSVVPNRGPVNPQNTGLIKPATGGVGSGGLSGLAMQQAARMGMSANDISSAIQQMERFESNPENIKKISGLKAAEGAMSQTTPSTDVHGLTGALNSGVGAFVAKSAQKHLAESDPEYQRYLNNARRVALAFTEILPRPNRELLHLEQGLSGQDIGWNPGMLQDIQGRRRSGLAMLEEVLAKSPMGAPKSGPQGNATAPQAPKGGFDPDAFYNNYTKGKKP